MIDWSWFATSGTALWMVLLSSAGIYGALIVFTRLAGLRSFSKLSSFDFSITVAFGTILASTLISKNPPLFQAIVALGILFGIQFFMSSLRTRSAAISRLVDNEPLLLMAGEEVLHENLRRARVTVDDLRAKLRESNVIHPRQIRAVVMESTGDISVLHAPPDGPELDLALLSGVRGIEHLRAAPSAAS